MPDEIKPLAECRTLQELYADPKRWTQGSYARTADGLKVWPFDDRASCFCLHGGVGKVYDTQPVEKGNEARMRLNNEIGRGGVPSWNDDKSRTVEEVQALVKKLNI